MPIPGTKSVARLGAMRLGASRLGYYQPWVKVFIGGADRTDRVRIGGASITQNLDGIPDTATVRVSGFTPVRGQEIKFYLGDTTAAHSLFAGHILSVTTVYEGDLVTNVAYDLACIDYTWVLRDKKVLKQYTSTSASDIVVDLITNFMSGITTVHVAAGLPTIDEFSCTNEDIPDALDRLAKLVGGYWYLDYGKDLHFFVTEEASARPVTDASDGGWAIEGVHSDLSQVRTRAVVVARGSTAVIDTPPGATTLPVADSAPFGSSGGIIQCVAQRITYSGKSTFDGRGSVVAGIPLSPSAPSASVASGQSGDALGAYFYQVVHRTAGGDSEPSSASGGVTVTAISAPGSAPATSVSSTTDGGVRPGGRAYGVTFVTSKGETLIASRTGTVTIAAVAPPVTAGMTITPTTGGSVPVSSTYYIGISYVTAAGETEISFWGTVVTSGTQNSLTWANIPTSGGDGRVTKRRLWRSASTSGGLTTMRLLTTLNDVTTTSYTDNVADASLGAIGGTPGDSTANTTGGQCSLTSIPTSSDARVTKRRVYRTAAGGTVYKLLGTINDNVTTTFVDAVSDTSLGADEPVNDTSGGGVVTVTVPVGTAGVTARRIYRTAAWGSVYKLAGTINDNVTTTFVDAKADETLGDDAPAGSTVRTEAGSTTLRVEDLTQFPASGWASVNSRVIIQFSGRSGSSGAGSLTGIPASGRGSLVTSATVGAAVVNTPSLSGIPASGTGAILYPIVSGSQVDIRVEVGDPAAQANLASERGWSDGIIDDVANGGQMSLTEATARAEATLATFKDPIVTVTGTTRDPSVQAGRSITFTLTSPPVSGTFKIQRVTLTQLAIGGQANWIFPLRQVEASSVRFSFEDLLRRLRAGL